MVKTLYLLDRNAAIEKANRLKRRGIFMCVCPATFVSATEDPSNVGADNHSVFSEADLKGEVFGDNLSLWRFNEVSITGIKLLYCSFISLPESHKESFTSQAKGNCGSNELPTI
jgi:hypothetical protein